MPESSENPSATRPPIITIFSGLTILNALISGIIYPFFLSETPFLPIFGLIIGLYGLKVTGALFLLNMKRTGFFLYTIAEILQIALLPIYYSKGLSEFGSSPLLVSSASLAIFLNVIFGLIWILGFASALNKMK